MFGAFLTGFHYFFLCYHWNMVSFWSVLHESSLLCLDGKVHWAQRSSALDIDLCTLDSMSTAAFSLLGQYMSQEKQESLIFHFAIFSFFILFAVLVLNMDMTDF